MAWKQDGEDRVSVNGAKVEHVGAGGSKGNALWSQGGTGFWEFKVSGGSGTWVGVSTESKFAPGYGMKGLFYGGPGNLSDGSSLVTGHWGPTFGDGDTIGMRLEQDGDKINLAFSKNGAGLGVAFDISGWGGEELKPAVSMDGEGQGVEISSGALPSLDSFKGAVEAGEGIEGDWEGRFKLQVEKTGDSTWRIGAKVGNSMSCSVTESGGKYSPGPVMSTKMMPPPHLLQLEQEATSILQELTGIRREGETLILEGAGKIEICKAALGAGAATKEKINWMN